MSIFTFKFLVFVKILILFLDEYDGSIANDHVFCRDRVSIHPLKNLRLIISAFHNNLLNSVTLFMGICMYSYTYVPFNKYAKESSINDN